jgi:peptide/nickel transport system ATP-binding protein
VVAEVADDILVMYAGRGVEYGTAENIFVRPEHPYTWGLMASMPRLDREVRDRLKPIAGTPPSLINVPSGCPFHPRCPYDGRNGIPCRTVEPRLPGDGRPGVACHIPSGDRQRLFAEEVRPQL